MNLRQAKIKDIETIMEIECSSFIPEICETKNTFLERIEVFPEGFLLLEDDNNNVCGYFSSERWDCVHTESDFYKLNHKMVQSHKTNGTVLYGSSIAILPSYRGQGLGMQFFNAAYQYVAASCIGIKSFALLVNEAWAGAHHIYLKAGFKEIARFPNFFPVQNSLGVFSTGIIMEKSVI